MTEWRFFCWDIMGTRLMVFLAIYVLELKISCPFRQILPVYKPLLQRVSPGIQNIYYYRSPSCYYYKKYFSAPTIEFVESLAELPKIIRIPSSVMKFAVIHSPLRYVAPSPASSPGSPPGKWLSFVPGLPGNHDGGKQDGVPWSALLWVLRDSSAWWCYWLHESR